MAVVTKIELYGVNDAGDVRGFTVASGTLIPKGTVLKGSSPRTAIASSGVADPYAGVASADTSATDGTTRVGAWQNGILEFASSGTIPAFAKVVTGLFNGAVKAATEAQIASTNHVIVGYTLRTSSEGERVQVRVDN